MPKQTTNKPNPLAAALNKGKAELFTEPEKSARTANPKAEKTQTSREGKKTVIAYLDPVAVQELKILAVRQGKTQQDLIVEAINDVLVKYGQKGIA